MDADTIAWKAINADARDPRGAGLLFHGTGEPVDGPLRPGGDRLLWTTDNPLVAQTYIPVGGLISLVSAPLQPGDRVRPSKHSFWHEFAVDTLGLPEPDVEWDRFGQAISWALPKGWPTYGECQAILMEKFGYDFKDGRADVLHPSGPDGRRVVQHASWRHPGTVFVTSAEGLRILELSRGESDLTAPQHNDLGIFAKAEADGYDGVAIDDFCQSHDCGNVGHRSVGIFAAAAERLTWLSYPAVHRPLAARTGLATEEFLAWREGLSCEALPTPD